MFMTTPRSSSDSPVESESAFSISSWMRRMWASTSIVRSKVSGIGVICARMVVPVRVTSVARARAEPLDDDVDPARDLRHLADHADGADLKEIVRSGILVLVVLQHEEHQAIHTERAVDRLDRHRPIDGERLQRQRQRDRPPQRENGKFRRKLWSGLGHRGLKALGRQGSWLSASP